MRALSTLNCQSTPRCLSLLACSQAATYLRKGAMSPIRYSFGHCGVRELNSFSAMFNLF
jgi:hypothetical protein